MLVVTELLVVRIALILALGAVAWYTRPFDLPPQIAFSVGLVAAAAAIVLEVRFKSAPPGSMIGGIAGAIAGSLLALLTASVVRQAVPPDGTSSFIQLAAMALCLYAGAAAGATHGARLYRPALAPERTDTATRQGILDTSVIIDGRIADIAETGFLDGTLIIPQFVLRELQLVADSADSMKRNRGRRGLDVLQRLQKMTKLAVQIVETDFPNIKDVDMKLIELGKMLGCKVVTNDFNLNKIAQLHGVPVLNINELANALKPIVLPGETMRVFILKEGKEYNQGVAYLDDGTMVVVDNARRMISKTIDISVTSVLQTTAGKMIFGRFDERSHAIYDKSPERKEREQTGAAT